MFFERFRRSWVLLKASFRVLRQDPELALFPVISFLAVLLVAGTFTGLGFGVSGFDQDEGVSLAGVIFIVLFYFIAYFAIIYFQVALVAAVRQRLAGGNPNLMTGMQEANKRLGAILSWAFIAAIVGLLLKALEGAARQSDNAAVRIGGQIAVAIVGVAWTLATFFVVPVIAYEGIGGIEALRRSAGVVKRHWGEAVIGNAGASLIMLVLAILLGVIFIGGGAAAIGAGGGVAILGAILLAIGILAVAAVIATGTALQSVYQAVLYEYATTGRVTEAFTKAQLETAFQPEAKASGGIRRSPFA